MVFSSLVFCFIFFPIVFGLYLIADEKFKNPILLVASLFFYAFGEPKFVFVLMASILLNYLLALMIEKTESRLWLILAVLVNIGVLFLMKYLDFSIGILNSLFRISIPALGLSLPIGISFYTFQGLSYVADVYRKRVKAQRNLMDLALYISFFPQLIAGPIVRYSTIEEQLHDHPMSRKAFTEGMYRFLKGICKKVLLANNLSVIATAVWAMDLTTANPLVLWLGSICFTLQIYYDFSGYSDMAIGLAAMFGLRFEENFNYPYISKSVTEFWRRWHISLGQWFRDYVYIPLGGNRKGAVRTFFNILIVWTLTGLWHGANYTFIVWGLANFLFLVIEKYFLHPDKRNVVVRILWYLVTILAVNFGWVIFNSASLGQAKQFILGMLSVFTTGAFADITLIHYLHEYWFLLVASLVFAVPVVPALRQLMKKNNTTRGILAVAEPAILIFGFAWSVSYLVLGVNNPFLYFNF